jgi:protein-disulfide isomerase
VFIWYTTNQTQVFYYINRIIMQNSNRSTFIIAGAVVFAGLIIAAGIVFGSGDEGSTANTDTGSESNSIVATAEAAGLDTGDFQSCLESDKFQSEVQSDTENARAAGGQGTPYNVIALNDPLSEDTRSQISSQLSSINISEDGKRLAVSGAVPFNAMQQIIDLALNDPQSSGSVSTSSDIAINPITDEDHIRGNQDAAVKIVEYSDFGCPYCARFHQTMKQVTNNYDASEVAWVYRHFPIPQLHPQAPRLARASECAADLGGQEAFWTFADEVFAGGGN